ncbi:hypothetical protein CGLO_17882 [Colletotrichum gloeosporioides Cg-14]|uniref:Uncharacterized protein n=1 Tax=Colletotrichum gloeosporioides (strain Cg-14) TaxID=1237896 RepID=T0JVS8_COLGC|nr:hypothetical protein CGLO_17882 [Colletotrichum gloeosporioides Cg-14]
MVFLKPRKKIKKISLSRYLIK